jgi:hypothetical protein
LQFVQWQMKTASGSSFTRYRNAPQMQPPSSGSSMVIDGLLWTSVAA